MLPRHATLPLLWCRGAAGLVIYWFDFVEDAELMEKWRREGLLVLNAMPDTVVQRSDLHSKASLLPV